MGRPVEAELLLQLRNELGIEAARAGIPGGSAVTCASPLLALSAEVALPTARAQLDAGRSARQVCNDTLNRPAGRKLHDDEGEKKHPEYRRDDQQEAPNDISRHPVSPPELKIIGRSRYLPSLVALAQACPQKISVTCGEL